MPDSFLLSQVMPHLYSHLFCKQSEQKPKTFQWLRTLFSSLPLSPHPRLTALISQVFLTVPGIPAPELVFPCLGEPSSPRQVHSCFFTSGGSFLQCLFLSGAFPGTPSKIANCSSLSHLSALSFSLALMTF